MSSSGGNCTIIKSENTEIMIDAGASFKKIEEKYTQTFQKDLDKLDALFISHEHSDHVAGAGVVGRKLNCPIFIPEKSYNKKPDLFKNCVVNFVQGGDVIPIGDFSIKTFSTRHDSEECIGFVVTEIKTNLKIAYLTDTGSISKLIRESLKDCDGYMIESDYDEESLMKYAEYDEFLKERIRSDFGHLSNQQSLEYVNNYLNLDKTHWILFGHLSERTNSPDLLKEQIEYKFPERHWDKFHVAKGDVVCLEIKEKL